MSLQNYVPTVWSPALLTAFRKRFVFGGLVNRNYQGAISRFGDSVKITTPAPITVGNYAGTVTYQAPTSTQQTLVIDQDKYWAFEVDDLEQVQSNVALMAPYIEEAAVSLADAVDADLAGLYASSGLTSIALDLGTDDFYDKMVLAGQQLDEANVPRTGRWVVMTPKGYADILKNDAFIHATSSADQVIRTGQVGSITGFTVYVSNNIVNSASNTFQYVYGTNQAITFAEQLVKVESLRRDASFDDAIRGRLVFGRKVVRPFALGAIASDET